MDKTGLNEGLIVFILILMDDIMSLFDQVKQRFCQTDTHGVLKRCGYVGQRQGELHRFHTRPQTVTQSHCHFGWERWRWQ